MYTYHCDVAEGEIGGAVIEMAKQGDGEDCKICFILGELGVY